MNFIFAYNDESNKISLQYVYFSVTVSLFLAILIVLIYLVSKVSEIAANINQHFPATCPQTKTRVFLMRAPITTASNATSEANKNNSELIQIGDEDETDANKAIKEAGPQSPPTPPKQPKKCQRFLNGIVSFMEYTNQWLFVILLALMTALMLHIFGFAIGMYRRTPPDAVTKLEAILASFYKSCVQSSVANDTDCMLTVRAIV